MSAYLELSTDRDFTDYLRRCQESPIRIAWERSPLPVRQLSIIEYDQETNRLREVARRGMTFRSSSDEGIPELRHEETDDCICGPTVEAVKKDDGSIGWLIIHHSLDARERDEVSA